MDNNIKKDNDGRKITFLVVAILVLMITVSGGTYAYFVLSTPANNAINGTAASASLTLAVTEQQQGGTSSYNTKSGVMVPQLESALGTAMGNNYKCVDGNGNTVCKVYSITVTNTSSAAVKVDGSITFTNSSMPNLKWRKVTNATTLGSDTAKAATNNTAQDLATNVSLAKTNGAQTYYIVVWIDEINSAQTDTGTFRATVSFVGDDGKGITSTVVS